MVDSGTPQIVLAQPCGTDFELKRRSPEHRDTTPFEVSLLPFSRLARIVKTDSSHHQQADLGTLYA